MNFIIFDNAIPATQKKKKVKKKKKKRKYNSMGWK